jgi:hypothetical protein
MFEIGVVIHHGGHPIHSGMDETCPGYSTVMGQVARPTMHRWSTRFQRLVDDRHLSPTNSSRLGSLWVKFLIVVLRKNQRSASVEGAASHRSDQPGSGSPIRGLQKLAQILPVLMSSESRSPDDGHALYFGLRSRNPVVEEEVGLKGHVGPLELCVMWEVGVSKGQDPVVDRLRPESAQSQEGRTSRD